jgi:hypothetical protein
MLRNLPVVLEGYKLRVVEDPAVKTYKNKDTGKQEISTDPKTGATLYQVAIYMKPLPTEDGRPAPKGVELKVTLETEPPQEVVDGVMVELHQPRVSQFPMDNGGTGLSMKALGVKLAG